MGGPKGHQRGNKTHRADLLQSRAASEPAEEAIGEEPELPNDKADADDHPTGRMNRTGKADSHTVSPPHGDKLGR